MAYASFLESESNHQNENFQAAVPGAETGRTKKARDGRGLDRMNLTNQDHGKGLFDTGCSRPAA